MIVVNNKDTYLIMRSLRIEITDYKYNNNRYKCLRLIVTKDLISEQSIHIELNCISGLL